MRALLFLLLASAAMAQDLLTIKRVHVEKLGGGEVASHVRDMIISSLQRSGLYSITENPEKADAILRGSAEDLVFTDTFQSSDGINIRANAGEGDTSGTTRSGISRSRRNAGISVGEEESRRTAERKHEAAAAVRLVNKDGDVVWSTTQESLGGKFRGASADVAEKIVKQLVDDVQKAKKK